MTKLLDYLADHVLLCDGAMGTQVQARDLDIERDYLGSENCTEILTKSRPDMVRDIHRTYLAAGADAAYAVGEAEAKRVRRLVMIEVHVLALVPLFAALMARGLGG